MPYRLPALLAAPEGSLVFVVEGEKDADRLAGLDLLATTNAGGAGTWREDYNAALIGRRVVIAPDNDNTGREHAETVQASLVAAGVSVAILELEGLPPKGDVSDWLNAGGTAERLVALAEAALDPGAERELTPPPEDEFETKIAKLAALDALAYERARNDAASDLDVRVSVLDKIVAKARPPEITSDTDEMVEEIEPWPDEVDGAALAEEVRDTLLAHVVFGRVTDADVLAIWIIATCLMDSWRLFPKVMITSPTKRCGKTTLLETIEALVHRGLMCANITAAALFRAIDKWKPSLLLDETDQFLKDKPELNGILNAGHSVRTAYVFRCVGDDNDVERFSVWGAQAFASIGKQRDTLIDRSIVIALRRKLKTDKVKRLPADLHEQMLGLRRQMARWAADNVISLGAMAGTADDEPPACGNDRLQDNYTPIWRLARLLGGEWPARIAKAYAAHAGSTDDSDEPDAILLMQDMLEIFGTQPALHTETLLAELHKMEDRPWAEYDRGRPLTATVLADLLKPFEIKPKLVRVRGIPLRGYERVAIANAAVRYVDELPAPVVDTPSLDPPLNPLHPLQR